MTLYRKPQAATCGSGVELKGIESPSPASSSTASVGGFVDTLAIGMTVLISRVKAGPIRLGRTIRRVAPLI
jgi:hypothetical protein